MQDIQLYKYETHLHTSQGSLCGSSSGAEQVRFLKEIGYSGCFVTDHFFGGNTAVDRRLPRDVKIHLFCQGYEDALEEGKKLGFSVFFGLEYGWRATELLTYGIDKQFLLDHPEIDRMEPVQYISLVHSCGGFVVHPHPFREAGYIDTIRLYPRLVDGVEVINASHRDESFNLRARQYAESYSLPMTGGSDTHSIFGYPGGGIVLDEPLLNPHDYLERLKSGRIVKILERSDDYANAKLPLERICDPGDFPKRPDLGLLPAELRKRAEDAYRAMGISERKL